MRKNDYIYWKKKYNNEEDTENKRIEENLRKKINKNKFLSKEDLILIIKWKFQGNLSGRQKIILNIIKNEEAFLIEGLSTLAFKSEKDEIRLKLLSCIKGVGNALSSVILAFYDPYKYGVLDIHVWREMFGKEPKDIFSNQKRAINFFNELRKISKKIGLPCREIEKALFKKNFDESK